MRQLVTWHLVRERGATGLALGSLPSVLFSSGPRKWCALHSGRPPQPIQGIPSQTRLEVCPLILYPIELTVNHDRRYFCLPPMPPIILEQRLLILTSLSLSLGSPAISELFPGQYAFWEREHVGEVIPSGRAAHLSLT